MRLRICRTDTYPLLVVKLLAALRDTSSDEQRGGYPAGHKPADQLQPPPPSVVQNPAA